MKRKIVVIVGSESDLPNIRDGINALRIAAKQGLIEYEESYICSAHRNGAMLREVLRKYTDQGVDVIVAVAGKLAALFGDADAYLRNELHNSHTRVIAVPLKGKTEEASLAARLSAIQVPNSQLIFEEEFFQNPTKAFEYAISGDLPVPVLEKQKPAVRLTPTEAYNIARIKYPALASYDPIIHQLEANGFHHLYTGKTRETFINPKFPDLLYILATDRISIFDIVLNAQIELKGAVLTAMTIYWLKNQFADVPNHLVAFGSGIGEYLPAEVNVGPEFQNYLEKHLIVVRKTRVLKVEAIVRGYLSGSGLVSYNENGTVCGIKLMSGLKDGSEIPPLPIFTPSTKADYGDHDENISFEEAIKIIGAEEANFVKEKSLYLYSKAREKGSAVGIVIADTKFEFGIDSDGQIRLIDEVLTPDSSRFWPERERLEAMKENRTPASLDKQPVRDAGKKAGVKENQNWIPPEDLLQQASENYQKIFELLAGKSLQEFWSEDMGIQEPLEAA